MQKQRRKSDQRLGLSYVAGTFPLLFKHLIILCGCTARFVSDLVGNPGDRFPHKKAHMIKMQGKKEVVIPPLTNGPSHTYLRTGQLSF